MIQYTDKKHLRWERVRENSPWKQKSSWTWNSRSHLNHNQAWREPTHACSLGQPTFIRSYPASGPAQKTMTPTSGWGFAEQLTQFRKSPQANLIWAIPPPWESLPRKYQILSIWQLKTNPHDQSKGGCQPLQTLGVPGPLLNTHSGWEPPLPTQHFQAAEGGRSHDHATVDISTLSLRLAGLFHLVQGIPGSSGSLSAFHAQVLCLCN